MNKLTGEHQTLSQDFCPGNTLSDKTMATWKQLADCSASSTDSSSELSQKSITSDASLTPRASLDQAREILAAARQEAQQLLDNAKLQAQEKFETARQEGFIDGQQAAICQFLNLERIKQIFIQSSEKELLSVIQHITQAVLADALKIQPESISKRLKIALQQQPLGDSFTLVVHPENQEHVQKQILQDALSETLKVKVDPTLTPGTFHLTTSMIHIESNPLSHLRRITDHLQTSLGAAEQNDEQNDNLIAALREVIFKETTAKISNTHSSNKQNNDKHSMKPSGQT